MAAITTTPDATAVLEAQIAGLREVSDLLRHQLDDLREDRDRWRVPRQRSGNSPATTADPGGGGWSAVKITKKN